MGSDNKEEDLKKDARIAGVFTSIGVAGTTALGITATKTFGDVPIELTYAAGGATAYGLLYTIQSAVDLNFKYAAESIKGFIALPLLASSIYLISENIDLSSLSKSSEESNIDNEQVLNIDLSEKDPSP